jgi:hypothetical protein
LTIGWSNREARLSFAETSAAALAYYFLFAGCWEFADRPPAASKSLNCQAGNALGMLLATWKSDFSGVRSNLARRIPTNSCGTTDTTVKAEAFAARQGEEIPMSEERKGTRVTFLDQTGFKSVEAVIADTVNVKRILPNIITKMSLPVMGPDGQPMSYSLDHKEGGKRLREEQTLPEAAVQDGHHLIVYPEIVAG